MNKKTLTSDFRFPLEKRKGSARLVPVISCRAFSLIEVLVVVSLLALIVLVLVAVFNSTQVAFRSGVTQTGVLEDGRDAMDLVVSDLKGLTPSDGVYYTYDDTPNFVVTNNATYSRPLVQSLPGTEDSRSNFLQQIFILNHENTKWWGVCYAIATNSPDDLYALYRMQYPPPPGGVIDPNTIFTNQAVRNFFLNPTNGGSHLIDGVLHFVVRAYDNAGILITNGYYGSGKSIPKNLLNYTWFYPTRLMGNEVGFSMYGNVIPASVEVEIGVLEDRPLQRAESLPFQSPAQTTYLQQQAGRVHVFRQRVTMPNVDRTAYR